MASCNLGQDSTVDCRACSSTNPEFCQPRGFSPTGATTCSRVR
jgi:hypothetical protein